MKAAGGLFTEVKNSGMTFGSTANPSQPSLVIKKPVNGLDDKQIRAASLFKDLRDSGSTFGEN